jgi:hypothetical protein
MHASVLVLAGVVVVLVRAVFDVADVTGGHLPSPGQQGEVDGIRRGGVFLLRREMGRVVRGRVIALQSVDRHYVSRGLPRLVG